MKDFLLVILFLIVSGFEILNHLDKSALKYDQLVKQRQIERLIAISDSLNSENQKYNDFITWYSAKDCTLANSYHYFLGTYGEE